MIASIALALWDDSRGAFALIGAQRATHIVLRCSEMALLISPDVAFVALMRFDDFSFAHMISLGDIQSKSPQQVGWGNCGAKRAPGSLDDVVRNPKETSDA